MSHRKISHLTLINACRYYEKGECKFGTLCWYKHSDDSATEKKKYQLPQKVSNATAVEIHLLLKGN